MVIKIFSLASVSLNLTNRRLPISWCNLKIALAFFFISLSFATLEIICLRRDTAPSFEPTAFLYFWQSSFYTPTVNDSPFNYLYVSQHTEYSTLSLVFEVDKVKTSKHRGGDYEQISIGLSVGSTTPHLLFLHHHPRHTHQLIHLFGVTKKVLLITGIKRTSRLSYHDLIIPIFSVLKVS